MTPLPPTKNNYMEFISTYLKVLWTLELIHLLIFYLFFINNIYKKYLHVCKIYHRSCKMPFDHFSLAMVLKKIKILCLYILKWLKARNENNWQQFRERFLSNQFSRTGRYEQHLPEHHCMYIYTVPIYGIMYLIFNICAYVRIIVIIVNLNTSKTEYSIHCKYESMQNDGHSSMHVVFFIIHGQLARYPRQDFTFEFVRQTWPR